MHVLPIVNKARKPKFELHLWIYDLNNVPLVSGASYVKWHLPSSIHHEHRGRTSKCTIDKVNHRVTYNYSKTIPLRISIDRTNNLSECPIDFEVLQEFPLASGGRDEKISLGNVKLNLSEYVEESESFPRRSMASRTAVSLEHARDKVAEKVLPRKGSIGRPTSSGGPVQNPPAIIQSPATNSSAHPEEQDTVDEEAEEGIVRRYLMQDSKINSTLKIGILMVQVDGERNYSAPALKSATMFNSGISGLISGGNDQMDPEQVAQVGGSIPNVYKPRDASEAQDMYRRVLAASWDCQPGELPANECIEDIFAGGSGWVDGTGHKTRSASHSPHIGRTSSSSSISTSSDDALDGTLRPSVMRRIQAHMRSHSNMSDRSTATITGRNGGEFGRTSPPAQHPHHKRRGSGHSGHSGRPTLRNKDSAVSLFDDGHSLGLHHRNESLTSMAPTLGSVGTNSERGGTKDHQPFRRKEIGEDEIRDDLVAWRLPGTVT
ncbi:hypothetical protein F5Y18DRAFT_116355 [Xylariaceae sp. FL1019]|nr:hypothetical protein F5Y18DRAFT_116355 [Xylariaceae sp. FL1019]